MAVALLALTQGPQKSWNSTSRCPIRKEAAAGGGWDRRDVGNPHKPALKISIFGGRFTGTQIVAVIVVMSAALIQPLFCQSEPLG